MKELSLNTRRQVIKLFLSGLSYDEIALKLGIGKGSVVNIIQEFKEGDISLTQNLADYIDALRRLSVDIRKNDTSIGEVMGCLIIYNKVKRMGVDDKRMESWLDIAREMASGSASAKAFTASAIELAGCAHDTSLSYSEIVSKCKDNYEHLVKLQQEVTSKSEKLENLEKLKMEMNQEIKVLKSDVEAASINYREQRAALESDQEAYLARHNLNWKKINEAITAINEGLSKSGISQQDIAEIKNRALTIGSLYKLSMNLKKEAYDLNNNAINLKEVISRHEQKIKDLGNQEEKLNQSIFQKTASENELNEKIQAMKVEVAQLASECCTNAENLYLAKIMIDFLYDKREVSDAAMDRLVNTFIALRQKRMGINPRTVTDANGKIICECALPRPFTGHEIDKVDTEEAKGLLATLLTPMVKDHFVSRFDYDLAKLEHNFSKQIAVMSARIETMQEERSRRWF